MEYLSPVLAFLGGGVVLAIVNGILNRRRSTVETAGIQDDQTRIWRDNALHLSDEIIEKDRAIHTALKLANDLMIERDNLAAKLQRCLAKIDNCDCH